MALQLQIQQLRGRENYGSWSIRVRTYLQQEDLWDVVENPAASLQNHQDMRAKFIIFCLIEDKFLEKMDRKVSNLIMHSAFDIWNLIGHATSDEIFWW